MILIIPECPQPVTITKPLSRTLIVDHDLLYVLNAGGTGNISGFIISKRGRLAPLPDSTRPLSSATSGPGQVQFSPDGGLLVVT
jgi:hypothetical protein